MFPPFLSRRWQGPSFSADDPEPEPLARVYVDSACTTLASGDLGETYSLFVVFEKSFTWSDIGQQEIESNTYFEGLPALVVFQDEVDTGYLVAHLYTDWEFENAVNGIVAGQVYEFSSPGFILRDPPGIIY